MGGEHIHSRTWRARFADADDRLLAIVAAERAACDRGEHIEFVVPRNRVCYGPFGVRWNPGEKYCRRCHVRLDFQKVGPRPRKELQPEEGKP